MRAVLDHVAVRTVLVLIVVLVLQLTLMPKMQIDHADGDLMLLFALSAAMVMGPDRGSIAAFGYGIAFDLMLQTPFGLSALVYVLAAYALGHVHRGLSRANWRVASATLAGATALSVVAYGVLAQVFGEPWLGVRRVLEIAAVEAAFSAFLGPVAVRITRWTMADTRVAVPAR